MSIAYTCRRSFLLHPPHCADSRLYFRTTETAGKCLGNGIGEFGMGCDARCMFVWFADANPYQTYQCMTYELRLIRFPSDLAILVEKL